MSKFFLKRRSGASILQMPRIDVPMPVLSFGRACFGIGALSISVRRDRGDGAPGHPDVSGHGTANSRDVDGHAGGHGRCNGVRGHGRASGCHACPDAVSDIRDAATGAGGFPGS